uniref:Uncharacterized protein n=1 Tax=Tetraselmis sp. GSL018 TaxID=582737 RepID=A0A061QQ25_9CHLO
MDAAMRIGSGGHQRATVQAVILCGGFGGDLVNDVLHEIGSVRDTRRANYYRSLLDGGPGEEHITEALVPVHRASALYHLLLSMESSRRLHPLDRNVFVVCNEANRGRFMQEETGFSDRAWSSGGMRLRRENVISNHASAPAEWAGEGGDLQAALRSGLLDPGADLLVVRGSMLLLPDYNFSRVVEHALVHSCNCVAYAQACGRRADLMRWRPSPPFVLEVEKPGSSSSRIAQASRRAPREGEYGAVGLALLKAAEIQQAALGAVEDAWLEEVALRPLMDGRCASGIDLQAGHFSVATLAGWSYADALFDTYAFTLEQDRRLAKSDNVSSLDFGEGITELGLPGDVLHRHALSKRLAQADLNERKGSSGESGPSSALEQPATRLPASFYMSQYRRSAMVTQHLLHLQRSG